MCFWMALEHCYKWTAPPGAKAAHSIEKFQYSPVMFTATIQQFEIFQKNYIEKKKKATLTF